VSGQEALGRLRDLLVTPKPSLERMIKAGPAVRARFQSVFKPDNLMKLTKEDFHSFLIFRNNEHWLGLQRKGPQICSDMDRLRTSLGVLLDESRAIQERLDALRSGRAAVPGMGRAILTAILLVMYPEQYGVWNNTSQAAMESLDVWPKFDRGESFGRRYAKVNAVLLDIARELTTDLWTLDGLWWAVLDEEPGLGAEKAGASVEGPTEDALKFGLERHLHDFLRDNWEKTELGQKWDLYSEDGDDDLGYEYPTPIGRIDLLARNKKEKAWLVVELKRNQTSDETVGQALRYMSYVREHLAKKDDRVEGLIVAHSGDEKLRYALAMVPSLSLMLYEVDFRLRQLPKQVGGT
jgi:hypothetical protein